MNPVLPKSIGNMAVNTPFDSASNMATKEGASKEFESFFVGFIFEEAFKNISTGEGYLEDNGAMDTYRSLFVQEVSKQAAAAGKFGLSEQLMGKGGVTKTLDIHVPTQLSSGYEVSSENLSFALPTEGQVTSHFGMRKNPVAHGHSHHDGMDFAMPIGTPIKAAEDGKVVHSGPKGGYGHTVVLDHGNGYTSLYAHQSKTLLQEGAVVKKGEVIGLSGNSGRSTGPHLHFEVRKGDQPIDPKGFLEKGNKI